MCRFVQVSALAPPNWGCECAMRSGGNSRRMLASPGRVLLEETEDFARDEGETVSGVSFAAGIRLWF